MLVLLHPRASPITKVKSQCRNGFAVDKV